MSVGFGDEVEDPDDTGDVQGWINEKSIEVWARDQTLPEPMNPVQVEAAIQWCQHHLARGVGIVREFQKAWLEADAAYDRAYAMAFLRHLGPQTEKRQAAEIAPEVVEARDARDVAKLAYDHAQRTHRRLEKELSGFQSLNKAMGAAYGATTGFGS
jgi:hypothetical protein